MKNLMLVVNPFSGAGGAKTALFSVLDAFCKHDFSPTVYISGANGNSCQDIVYKYGEKYDLIVCIGGDGTLSSVTSGLMMLPIEKRPRVGYIPMGTANDVATTLALSHDPEIAVETIVKGIPAPYDMGLLNCCFRRIH